MAGSGSDSPPFYVAPVPGLPAAGEKPSTDSAAVEEPSVQKSRQVPKFEDRYARVIPYCDTFLFEVDPNCDPSLEVDTDSEDEDSRKPIQGATASIPTLVKYVNQIRESFGFDVDCVAPNWFQGFFYPVNMEWVKSERKQFYEKINKIADFAIEEINADLVHDGKSSVELVKLEKVVMAVPGMNLLTLRVETKERDQTNIGVETKERDQTNIGVETKERDQTNIGAEDDGMNAQTIQAIVYEGHGDDLPLSLDQWRFKPAEPDYWYKAPPLPQRGDERDDV